MTAPGAKTQEEKLYAIPERVLEEWDRLGEAVRVSEARATKAEREELGANVIMLASLATWVGIAFLGGGIPGHRGDVWMYLIAAQVLYYFTRILMRP